MKNNLNEITTCEVCGNSKLISVLNLGLHPMCDDLVKISDNRICKEYPIEILFCEKCFTGHQRFQIPKAELFPTTYHYRARFTADVLKGMVELVESCEKKFGNLNGKKVLDIGCNDGSLLDFFKQKGASTLGIEPTDAYIDAKQKGHVIYNNFFTAEIAELISASQGKPDFITFTNVFAHIENLNEVLSGLKKLMGPKTVIVIENHYLGAVLDGNQFDTFYHEHPRTYSYSSFVHIANSLGVQLSDVEFPSRYGGNIRVFLSEDVNNTENAVLIQNDIKLKESQFLNKFTSMRNNIEIWKTNKKRIIHELVTKYGKLKAKAFPGRAAILVKLLDLDENLISSVYEKPGSMKIGCYLPGTRIPIISDNDLDAKDQPILNMAWHISREIHTYLIGLDYTGSIVDILNTEDFNPNS